MLYHCFQILEAGRCHVHCGILRSALSQLILILTTTPVAEWHPLVCCVTTMHSCQQLKQRAGESRGRATAAVEKSGPKPHLPWKTLKQEGVEEHCRSSTPPVTAQLTRGTEAGPPARAPSQRRAMQRLHSWECWAEWSSLGQLDWGWGWGCSSRRCRSARGCRMLLGWRHWPAAPCRRQGSRRQQQR